MSSSILGVGDFVRMAFVAVDFETDSTKDLDLDLDRVVLDGEIKSQDDF